MRFFFKKKKIKKKPNWYIRKLNTTRRFSTRCAKKLRQDQNSKHCTSAAKANRRKNNKEKQKKQVIKRL